MNRANGTTANSRCAAIIPCTQMDSARFIGTIERFAEGWRASFRLRVPGEVFAQPGNTEVFATELQATKWLHTQAAARGFSSIDIERQN
jgi:hypothetical protein